MRLTQAGVGIGISGVDGGDPLVTKTETTKNGKTVVTYGMCPADSAESTGGQNAGVVNYLFGWTNEYSVVDASWNNATIKFTVFDVKKGKTQPMTFNLKLDHFYGAERVDTPATCTSAGIKFVDCSACGDSKQMSIPKLGHNLTKVAGYPATTTSFGQYTYWKCSRCSQKFLDSAGTKPTEITSIGEIKNAAVTEDYYTYTGKAITPKVVVFDTNGVIPASNYTVTFSNNVDVGTGHVKVTMKGELYSGTLNEDFDIVRAKQSITASGATKNYGNAAFNLNAKSSVGAPLTYTSSNTKVATVSRAGLITIKGVGTAKITIKASGSTNYSATSKSVTIVIKKGANPLKIKAKTATVKYAAVKKKAQKLATTRVITFSKKGAGTMSYVKASGNKNITIAKTTGKVTVKKGTKKGTYKVKVKVTAAGNAKYKKATKSVTFKVVVK